MSEKQFQHEELEKPFECTICNLRYTYRYNLNRHIIDKHEKITENELKDATKIHESTGEKPPTNSHLRNERLFECTICNNRYTRSFTLERHLSDKHGKSHSKFIKIHESTGEKPPARKLKLVVEKVFECTICNRYDFI